MHIKSLRHIVFLLWHILTLSLLKGILLKYNLLPPYNKGSDFIFYVWLLSTFKSQYSSLSFAPHLGRLLRKARCSFLWEPEVQTNQAPAHVWEPASHLPLFHKKINSASCTLWSLFFFFFDLCEADASLPRKAHYMNDKLSWLLGMCSIISLKIQTKFWVRGLSGFCFCSAHLQYLGKTSLRPWDETSKSIS